jgi:hypothetical protein
MSLANIAQTDPIKDLVFLSEVGIPLTHPDTVILIKQVNTSGSRQIK